VETKASRKNGCRFGFQDISATKPQIQISVVIKKRRISHLIKITSEYCVCQKITTLLYC